MRIPLICITFYLIATICCFGQQLTKDNLTLYAIAELPTPVLNTPDFSFVFGNQDGKTLHLDDDGLIREVEFIALPKTVFKIKNTIKKGAATIYRVTTEDYPYPIQKGYFIDSRLVKTSEHKPPSRRKRLPDRKAIIDALVSSEGGRYIWGGNYKEGVSQMISFYPPSPPLNDDLKEQWMLKGVDCSGLLYEATGGCTPRNTSSLITFGEPVKIVGLSASQIIQILDLLDIIVWKGHVIIVLDKKRTIESRLDYDKEQDGNQGGVRTRTLKEVLDETLKERVPVNNYEDEVGEGKEKFVVRRWYSSTHNQLNAN
ncbi:MAG: peptidoglycan endopeptidase [Deltaproteobacteria bacterium]|nr:peptidoglycan endopeptidase [Deltaproteobacteria bacterium]